MLCQTEISYAGTFHLYGSIASRLSFLETKHFIIMIKN